MHDGSVGGDTLCGPRWTSDDGAADSADEDVDMALRGIDAAVDAEFDDLATPGVCSTTLLTNVILWTPRRLNLLDAADVDFMDWQGDIGVHGTGLRSS